VGGGQPFDLEIPLLRTIFYLFNRVETAGNCLFLELNGKYTLIIPGPVLEAQDLSNHRKTSIPAHPLFWDDCDISLPDFHGPSAPPSSLPRVPHTTPNNTMASKIAPAFTGPLYAPALLQWIAAVEDGFAIYHATKPEKASDLTEQMKIRIAGTLLRTIFYLFNRVETAGNCLFLELNGI
jgi:hypothetical protein